MSSRELAEYTGGLSVADELVTGRFRRARVPPCRLGHRRACCRAFDARLVPSGYAQEREEAVEVVLAADEYPLGSLPRAEVNAGALHH